MTSLPAAFDLEQLQEELIAAGIGVGAGLVAAGTRLYRSVNGIPEDLPAAADAIIAAHVVANLPAIHSVRFSLDAERSTSDATPTVLGRFPIPPMHIWDIFMVVYGVGRTSGETKKMKREGFVRRLGGQPALVGTLDTPTPDKATAGAGGWSMVPSFAAGKIVITVTGQAGQVIDWSIFAEVRKFSRDIDKTVPTFPLVPQVGTPDPEG